MRCPKNCTILLVDDELEMCLSLSEFLRSKGYSTLHTTNPLEVPHILANHEVGLIIMDIRMPEMGGIDLLKVVKEAEPAMAVIMITGYPTVDNAVRAMKYGAVNFYTKPLRLPELLKEIHELTVKPFRSQRTRQKVKHTIICQDPNMQELLKTIQKASQTAAPVLITGESGTGKELVANSLHELSPRAANPFVKVNCAALPEELLESELFGHKKGAFTGAAKDRKGRFELANTGTIFLDEIGDMSLRTQAKILRAIQDQAFEQVGGARTITTDSRILAATNKELDELILSEQFREDLYYRLSVITLHLPPLRERRADIPLLTASFISHYNRVYDKQIRGLSDEVEWFFQTHKWPGNVRELKNCIERAVIFCEQETIEIKDLATQYKQLLENPPAAQYDDALESLNREIILDALERSRGVKKKAAALLNIDRRTLYNRMKKLGLR